MTTAAAPPTLAAVRSADLDHELEDWGPRAGADSGSPRTSGRVLWSSPDGTTEVGVWACTPGGWSITDRPDTETVRILAGRARLTDEGGGSVVLEPGDVLVLPVGWSGRWDVLEDVRKLYVVVRPPG